MKNDNFFVANTPELIRSLRSEWSLQVEAQSCWHSIRANRDPEPSFKGGPQPWEQKDLDKALGENKYRMWEDNSNNGVINSTGR